MKKGTRICAAGLLAMTMALGSAPVLGVMTSTVALAAEQTVTINGQAIELANGQAVVLHTDSSTGKVTTNFVASASDLGALLTGGSVQAGDTVLLGEGQYTITSSQALNKEVTVKGISPDKTTVTGGVKTASAVTTVETGAQSANIAFENLTLKYSGTEPNVKKGIEIVGNATNVTLTDCVISGYVYGVSIDDAAWGSSFSLNNVKLTNVWCGASLNQRNTLDLTDFAEGSQYVYAVHGYTGTGSTNQQNGYYSTVDQYESDKTLNNGHDDRMAAEPNANETYKVAATNGEFKYTTVDEALSEAEPKDTVTINEDAEITTGALNDAYLTIDGNGHTLTVKNAGGLQVVGNHITLKNVKLAATDSLTDSLLKYAEQGSAALESTLENVTLDASKTSTNATKAMSADNVKLTVSGDFTVITGTNAGSQGIVLSQTSETSLIFADDAKVSFENKTGVKDLTLGKLNGSKPFATVTAADPDATAVVIDEDNKTFDVHTHNFTVSGAVDATADKPGYTGDKTCTICGEVVKGEEIPALGYADVTLTRLYNRFTGEHLFTGDQDEIDTLVSLGWTNEGAAWTAPGKSETPVYRLYNPFTGDHHYTANADEYDALEAEGWKKEGVAWYAADSEADGAVAVYRLYNPYATTATHHFTTDANEVVELVKAGWTNEGVAWYGLK